MLHGLLLESTRVVMSISTALVVAASTLLQGLWHQVQPLPVWSTTLREVPTAPVFRSNFRSVLPVKSAATGRLRPNHPLPVVVMARLLAPSVWKLLLWLVVPCGS